MNADALIQDLRAAGAKAERDVSLTPFSWYRIGGPADLLVTPRDADSLAKALTLLADSGLPYFVIGDGSNLLFDTAGYRGAIVRMTRALGELDIDRETGRVTAGAGLWVPAFARRLALSGLSGLEHIVGIPGTLGGLVVMNGGSQRKGIGRHVVAVEGLRRDGRPFVRTQEECAFAYRQSALQDGDHIVTRAHFSLDREDRRSILREQIDIMAARRKKFPKQFPNCGSVFLSNPAMYDIVGPPGRAIEDAGLCGTAAGGAQISPLHGNFIINRGGATSTDVLSLVKLARDRVYERTGYRMDCELIHVTPDGAAHPAHVTTDAMPSL